MPKGTSTTNEQKRKARKVKARERAVRRANNVLVNNVSPEERARRRGEDTERASRPAPSFTDAIRRRMGS